MLEIASWRFASELHRRHPELFTIIETHAGGGMYNCLDLMEKNSQDIIASFNRPGSFHNHLKGESISDFWRRYVDADDPKHLLDEISKQLRFPDVEKLSPTSRETLVYRFIATILTHSVFGVHSWDCRNGFFDTSGYGGGVVKWFENFHHAKRRLEQEPRDQSPGNRAYRFWFIRKNKEPVMCLHLTGLCWLRDDSDTYDLSVLFTENRRNIWQTVVSIAAPLMR